MGAFKGALEAIPLFVRDLYGGGRMRSNFGG